MAPRPILNNTTARRLFLQRHGLGEADTGPAKGDDLLRLITRLGFVQVDSINTVERAHHMILHARRQSYRPANLRPLLERDRTLFEHWTHDASIVPSEFYPHWKLRFERDAVRLKARWKNWHRDGFEQRFADVFAQVRDSGPCGSGDVGKDEVRGSGGWWDWHPSKTALEYLWRTGQLSVTRREAFRKVYDLSERVLPDHHPHPRPPTTETVDWACDGALERLGFATSGELAAFWDLVSVSEAKDWCAARLQDGTLIEADITCADGSVRTSFMRPETLTDLAPPQPPSGIRILSPFDPALRDRKRALRLFGFDYRIEVFVPAKDRKYGYYVFPVLEQDRLIGRIDMKCDRPGGVLNVTGFWPEPGVQMGKSREKRLETALAKTARFAGVGLVQYRRDWRRDQRQ